MTDQVERDSAHHAERDGYVKKPVMCRDAIMNRVTLIGRLPLLWLVLCLLAICGRASAQTYETREPNHGLQQRLLDRLTQFDREAKRLLKQWPQPIPPDPANRKLLITLETPVLTTFYLKSTTGQFADQRVFVAKLTLTNLTLDPKTIEPAQITLDADGVRLKNGDLDKSLQKSGVQIEQQFQLFAQLKPPSLTLPPGWTKSTWIVFGGLPRGQQIPQLRLLVDSGDKPTEFDINAWATEKLALTSTRLGPRSCLAVLTISGELNSVTVGAFLEELDRLAMQKVSRIVVRWKSGTPPLDALVFNWLTQAVQSLGRNENYSPYNQFPQLPNSFSEFRLAELPGLNQATVSSADGARGERGLSSAAASVSCIHRTMSEAVIAALRTMYEVLPQHELLVELRHGDTLLRCAALTSAGTRLKADDLPLLLELTEDADIAVQLAAVQTLRYFGDRAAIDKLLQLARKHDEPLTSPALESLAASRYADAHIALLRLFEDEPLEARKTIVKVMAQNPRPLWSEAIYKSARDPQSGLGREGLQALVRIGHPKLPELLKESLASSDVALRDAAYQELAQRNDPVSETIVRKFTLQQLELTPPTASMLMFLNKTKDQSAVPLLLSHLQNKDADHSALINTLAQIGDQNVAEILAEHYPRLKLADQVAVLALLGQLRSPLLLKVAALALESSDPAVVNTACQWLPSDGSLAAVDLLVHALDKATQQTTIIYVANALGQTATPEARKALRRARTSSDPQKQIYARTALQSLLARSPAMPFVIQARGLEQQGNTETALELFETAIKLDPELPEAYISRANMLIKQNKFTEAQKDFEKALSLDDFSSEAVTGVGITLAIAGRFEEGIKLLEENRAKFPNDNLFLYNAACVYGRAAEAVLKNEKLEDRHKKLAEFQSKAIVDLRDSIKAGFDEFDWMKKDPDLNSLHELPEFKELTK